MNNSKFIKTLLLVIIISILFIIIRTTYSKYVSSQDNSGKFGISKWHLLVNDQNIIENADFTETLTVELDSNENIAENVIVPTTTGHFDIELESTGTEKTFEYNIKFVDEDSNLPDFKIASYTLNGEAAIDIEPDQTEITGTVEPAVNDDGAFTDEEVINNFHFNIVWYDEDDNILDNYADVAISKKDPAEATIPIEITITQVED